MVSICGTTDSSSSEHDEGIAYEQEEPIFEVVETPYSTSDEEEEASYRVVNIGDEIETKTRRARSSSRTVMKASAEPHPTDNKSSKARRQKSTRKGTDVNRRSTASVHDE